MNIGTCDMVNLDELRHSLKGQFTAWDQAVQCGSTQAARDARARLLATARTRLAGAAASTRPGFYVFGDANHGLAALYYIGIAEGEARPIGPRIEDRFRDDSSLDVDLDHLPDDEVHQRIDQRLTIAMPGTQEATRLRYCQNTVQTLRLLQRSKQVFLFPCDGAPQQIRDAERLLISTAIKCGAPLTNTQHRNDRREASAPSVAAAVSVVVQLEHHGLPAEDAWQWRAAILERRVA